MDLLYWKILEGYIGVEAEDYGESSEYDDPADDEREHLAAQCRDFVDTACYRITNNIRDIIFENAIDLKLPPALKIHKGSDFSYFGTED